MSSEESCESCKHVTPTEERYLNALNEYFNFIMRARHWGPEVNDIITKEWTELRVARELLKDTDTIGFYVPPPPLVLNLNPNDGTDSLEDISEFLQTMALRRIFAMVMTCPDIKSKLQAFKNKREEAKNEEEEEDSDDEEGKVTPITICPGVTMEFVKKAPEDFGTPPVIKLDTPLSGEVDVDTHNAAVDKAAAFWAEAKEGRHPASKLVVTAAEPYLTHPEYVKGRHFVE